MAGAAVRVVAPESPELADVEWIRGEYSSAHLDGVTLAFAAGPRNVNARVVADARARGIWVGSASDSTTGDFILPAVRHAGRIQIAVSTAGASPRVAAAVAESLVHALPAVWEYHVDLLAELRDEVRATVPQNKRAGLWDTLTREPWRERIVAAGRIQALAEMRELVRAAAAP